MRAHIGRPELAARLSRGAERKMRELEHHRIMGFEDPGRADTHGEIARFLEYDIRYYRVAAAYYGDDIDSLEADPDDDLLFLTEVSKTSPKVYAEYLRGLSPEDREEEKITHKAVEDLKRSIAETMGAVRCCTRGGTSRR